MPLTDTKIRSLQPKDRQYKVADEKGLYLLVRPNGSKLWQHKVRFSGKEKTLSYGAYPEVGLAKARKRRDENRTLLLDGKDPALEQKKAKIAAKVSADNSFEQVALEFISKREKGGSAASTTKKNEWFLSLLKPAIGSLPVDNVEPQLLLQALQKIEAKGHYETAKKTRSFASRVFNYAVQTTRAQSNPALLLQGALIPPKVKHYSAILQPEEFGKLLQAIDGYTGYPVTCIALQIAPHVFLRSGELRQAKWEEIDLKMAKWTIPAERMKARKVHSFPLSKQVVNLIEQLRLLTDPDGFVFPAFHTRKRPLSENTLTQALRRLGYSKDEVSVHGFRATASTLLNESGQWNPDAIERALAHNEANAVRAAYHRGLYWDERVEMMQWWSNKLDELKAG